MPKYTITISNEELKALEGEMVSIKEWLENAVLNKARKTINRIVIKETGRNPKTIALAEKIQIVKDAKIVPLKDLANE